MPVYFIRAGEDGPIKIGHGSNPAARLSGCQIGNHLPLRLLATMPGAEAEEQELHKRFAAHRIRGEWFAPVGALLDFIAEHGTPVSAPEPPPNATPLERAILTVGSATALGRILGITCHAIAQWKRVPAVHVLKIERATDGKVSRHELRPDLYPLEAA